MAKSIVSLAIGLAPAEGKIASPDDKVSKYLPELAGYPLWGNINPQPSAHGVRRAVRGGVGWQISPSLRASAAPMVP